MWKDRQSILDAEEDIDYKNNNAVNPDTKKEYTLTEKTVIDKTLELARKSFDVSEMKYKHAEADIVSAQAKLTAAWRDYQEVSSTITAPASGIVNNLALASGVIIEASTTSNSNSTSNSSSSSNTVSSQKIGKINSTNGQLQATINLTEIDVTKVKPNQKATVTLDAYSDKTFTGKVLAVDTTGSVSSGVTSYPVTILLDSTTVNIYPNMAVNVQIITSVKTDVILIPTSAVQTSNGESIVQIQKDGKVSTVQVETGESNDTQIEIVSGIQEGDAVVTSTINSTNNKIQSINSSTTSPFSGFGGLNRTGSGSSNRTYIRSTNVVTFPMGGMSVGR